jgi:pseudouridine-5'-phosphate glycosidase
MGRQGGILTCVPVPLEDSLDKSMIDAVIDDALRAANKAKIEGPKVTPFVLGAIAEATKGTSVVANLSLARNNARVAAELAVQLSR